MQMMEMKKMMKMVQMKIKKMKKMKRWRRWGLWGLRKMYIALLFFLAMDSQSLDYLHLLMVGVSCSADTLFSRHHNHQQAHRDQKKCNAHDRGRASCRLMLDNHGQVPAEVWGSNGKGWLVLAQSLIFHMGGLSSRWRAPLNGNLNGRKVASLYYADRRSNISLDVWDVEKETVNWSIGCTDVIQNLSLELHLLKNGCSIQYSLDAPSNIVWRQPSSGKKKKALMNSFLAELAVQRQNVDQWQTHFAKCLS